jgi:hypothetical protein
MKLNNFALAVLSAAALVGVTPAQAYSWNTTNTSFSAVVGASNIDFGAGAVGTAPVAGTGALNEVIASGTAGGTNYQFSEGALYNLATSPLQNTTARPAGSVDNFWSVGTSPAEQKGPGVVTFSTAVSYLGFLYGSVDSYNKVSFFSGANNFLTLTGADISNPANGNQAVSKYFNFFAGAGQAVTKVIFSSTNNAFETDNFAVTAVPEVESYAMMLAGLGLMGTIARRRNKAKAA